MAIMRVNRQRVAAVLALALGACGQADADAGAAVAQGAASGEPRDLQCRIVEQGVSLPAGLSESSGAAFSRGSRGVFWSHGDSGREPVLYAVGRNGQALGRVRVAEGENRDWEDVAVGPCAGGNCVYLADIGNGRRDEKVIALFRFPEPAPGDERSADAEEFRARFPDGEARDAEALFVLPDGRVFVVNKGNQEAVELWQWPTPLRAGPVDLVRVRQLGPEPEQPGDRVTGASATQDGRWVAVRTYSRLAIYRTAELLGSGAPAYWVDLLPLAEPQGEAVAIESDGTVLLTSEAGQRLGNGRATWLHCPLPPR